MKAKELKEIVNNLLDNEDIFCLLITTEDIAEHTPTLPHKYKHYIIELEKTKHKLLQNLLS